MEEEIDLGKYIDVLLKWWWLIVLGTLLAGGSALLVSMITPPTYEATAGVVMFRSRAEISLGSGFESITDDLILGEAGKTLVELTSQRLASLAAMATNGNIAQQVADELSDVLDEDERKPSVLLGGVRGEVFVPEGGGTSDTVQIIVSHTDPEKAAIIANAWARAFETHVNATYSEVPFMPFADIQGQVQAARAEYDQAQEELLAFLSSDDRISELQRQVEEEEAIIAKLRSGRQEDVSAVVDSQVAVHKRLFNISIAAEIDSGLRVFERQRDELLREFERAYSRKFHLEDLLVEAYLMREQLVKGGTASARSSGLALLALKSRVFATAEGLPFETLDLQLPSVDGLTPASSADEQISDLDGLIIAMEEEVAALETSIQEQADALSQGEGYQFLGPLSPEYLNVAGSQAALALLRMKEWDGMISYSSMLDESLSQEIARLEDHVRSLQTEIASMSGVRDDLQNNRDQVWQTYTRLLSKQQEIGITKASECTEVRFASQALPPRKPVSPKKLLNTAVGLAMGLMMGVFGAFIFDYMGVEDDTRYLLGQMINLRGKRQPKREAEGSESSGQADQSESGGEA